MEKVIGSLFPPLFSPQSSTCRRHTFYVAEEGDLVLDRDGPSSPDDGHAIAVKFGARLDSKVNFRRIHRKTLRNFVPQSEKFPVLEREREKGKPTYTRPERNDPRSTVGTVLKAKSIRVGQIDLISQVEGQLVLDVDSEIPGKSHSSYLGTDPVGKINRRENLIKKHGRPSR